LTSVALLGALLAFAKLWPRPRVDLYAMDQRVKTLRREINEDLREVIGLLDSGAIAPRIGATFPLREAPLAHELLESRNNLGKIVLVP